MKLLYLTLLAISATHVCVDGMRGGKFSGAKSVPYQAQLYLTLNYYEYTTYCGASILSEYWLISAAHCIRNPDIISYQARVGSSTTENKGILLNISKIIVHGDYDPIYGWDSDICLIKLKTPIEFNEYQQPIAIARQAPQVGDIITVSGFGYLHYFIEGTNLQIARVPVIDEETCRKHIDIVTDNMFCSSVDKVDLCYGDSGGPAVFDGKLVGVTSQGCEYTKPNVFTNVPRFYDWIIHHTGIKYSD